MDTKIKLKQHLETDYPITIERLSDDDGGGYLAYLPDFGRLVIFGDGETMQEALDNLQKFKEYQFKRLVERGAAFPKPRKKSESSGKFVLRLPRDLHAQLAYQAEMNDTTLNQYCIYLLARNMGVQEKKAS